MLERLLDDLKLTPWWLEVTLIHVGACVLGVLAAVAWVGVWP